MMDSTSLPLQSILMAKIVFELPANANSFHAVLIDETWTVSVGVHEPDGDDYVETTIDTDLTTALVGTKAKLASHV